jgi:Zn-dependent protease with chaperone function
VFENIPGASGVAFVVAVIPACLLWWWGQALVRAADDRALPERLVASQRRHGFALAGAVALLISGWPSTIYWTLAVAIVARMIASYPLRRALYAETWSLAGYLFFVVRTVGACFGFWILLAVMPMLAGAAGPFDWLAAVAMAAVLLVWNARSSELFRLLLRPRPIQDPALLTRFTALAEACRLPLPRFEYLDLRGGAVANAIALPSVRQSSVIFTDALLARLEPDETVAICAHEIAHLEHYNPRRLRRIGLVNCALIALGLASVPFARTADSLVAPSLAWAGGLALMLALQARYRQRHETESDLRAVALTGNGDALISALIKSHAFAQIPRRWDTQREHQATHPSLARRIRAIRAATGMAPMSLVGPATFTSADAVPSLRLVTTACSSSKEIRLHIF